MWAIHSSRNSLPVCSVSVFHSLVRKERARTDRIGVSFSLILLDVESVAGKSLKNLYSLVGERVRHIDVFGWFDEKNMAVLLPSTNIDGCRELANDLINYLRLKNVHVPVKYLTYPAQKYEMQKIWDKATSHA